MNLEPTAAFVLHYSKSIYKNNLIKQYLEYIDFSSANSIIAMCEEKKISHLLHEAMCSRKYIITRLALNALEENNYEQIVIFASGKSPISLELLLNNKKQLTIFELDNASFNEKRNIFKKLLDKNKFNKLNFLETDITDSKLIHKLENYNFDKKKRTILIFEGITHYIDKKAYFKLLQKFSNNTKNKFIIEYAPEISRLSDDYQFAVKEVFNFIEKNYYSAKMTNYSKNEFVNFFKSINGEVNQIYDLEMISSMRKSEKYKFENNFVGPVEVIDANA
ncbi:class I SAM-dependent methyltransferase [Alphaproteobacteria bacterium]|nr:class I SAM-dependent methyltransferase [Alphaproteobacteria bacterium]